LVTAVRIVRSSVTVLSPRLQGLILATDLGFQELLLMDSNCSEEKRGVASNVKRWLNPTFWLSSLILACAGCALAEPASVEEPVDEVAKPPLTAMIARATTRAEYSALSEEVRVRVNLALKDNAATLAYSTCGKGVHPFWARILDKGGSAEATHPVSHQKLPVEEATAIVAYLIHASETDDSDHRASLRASPVVVAPALTVAEYVDASGQDLVTAIAIGYSVLGALGQATGPTQIDGLMSASLYGAVSSAAVASYLLDLDEEQTQNAIALAAASSGGLFQYYYDQTQEKRIIIARSSRLGVESALLALAGERAAPNVLDGRSGLFPVLARKELSPEEARSIVAKISLLDGPMYIEPKFYSTSASVIPYILGLDMDPRVKAIRANEVQSFVLIADSLFGVVLEDKVTNYKAPTNSMGAKINFNYVVSVFLNHGAVEPQYFEGAALSDPSVLELASKGRFEWAASDEQARLVIYLNSGESISIPPIIHDRNKPVPAFEELRRDKIDLLTREIWTAEHKRKIMAEIDGLERETHVGEWVERYFGTLCELSKDSK
jgi:2-methylcitrate dehydratase PrpD